MICPACLVAVAGTDEQPTTSAARAQLRSVLVVLGVGALGLLALTWWLGPRISRSNGHARRGHLRARRVARRQRRAPKRQQARSRRRGRR
jgi:hypothetical protein